MRLEEEILKRITPDGEHRRFVDRVVSNLMKKVEKEISRLNLPLEARLVGSVAKDTYLPNPDIDIFVMFPPSVNRRELETIGLDIGRRVLGGEERYAEHPYIHGNYEGLDVDLVPCYKIENPSNIKSAVDRTPFHTEFIKKNLADHQKPEVRLLKQFMKGTGVYGAEAKIQGFSGYLVELLILRYGDFLSTVKSASEWKRGETLWLERRGDIKFNDPLIFYDPVDLTRNVASPVSIDSFSRFIYACSSYLREKDERFFFPRKREDWKIKKIREYFKKRETAVVIVRFDRPNIVDDDLYPQIRKTEESVANLLKSHDFIVIDRASRVDRHVLIAFELQSSKLPIAKRHEGPPMWIDHSKRFLEKWKGGKGLSEPFIDQGKLVVIAKREYTDAAELLRERIKTASLGKDFKGMGFDVVSGKTVFRKDYRKIMTDLLDKRMPWEI
ncbi:MAG: CCA tRNA nucleotidyltransferase [Methanomassiliicoccales archaeon]|jgi:tRNA nucleotidyltransferase (CCA-adding enzyme)|nr:CCA tRNA nucleotidyltransferase [Methanomassiliicoccales archaeon]